MLTQKLLKQGYVAPKLRSSHQKLYTRHHDLVNRYEISISQMTMVLLLCIIYVDVFFPLSLPRLLSNLTIYMSNTAEFLWDTTAYSSRVPEFTPDTLVGVRIVMSAPISAYKRCSVRLYHQLFVERLMSYYVICVYLRIVMFNTYCVGFFLVCLCLVSCVPNVASVSGLSIFDCPLGIL